MPRAARAKRRGSAGKGRNGDGTRKTAPECCPDTFNVPANRSGNKVVRLAAGLRKAGEEFDMLATFKAAPPPCECGCCEYRQDVRGKFTYDGQKLEHPLAGGNLSETDWQEDSDAATGRPWYGHRSDTASPGGDNDRYLPDRAIGCEYRGHDYPCLSGAPGKTFSIDLEFRGTIVCARSDCKDAGQTLRETTWTVKFSGRLSRRNRFWNP